MLTTSNSYNSTITSIWWFWAFGGKLRNFKSLPSNRNALYLSLFWNHYTIVGTVWAALHSYILNLLKTANLGSLERRANSANSYLFLFFSLFFLIVFFGLSFRLSVYLLVGLSVYLYDSLNFCLLVCKSVNICLYVCLYACFYAHTVRSKLPCVWNL